MKKISAFIMMLTTIILITSTTASASTDISGPSVIHKEANQVFTISDLLGLYDHDVFVYEDNYTGHGNVAGEYIVSLYQGELTKDVLIIVIDSWQYKNNLNTYKLENSTDVLFVADYKDIYVSNDRLLSLYEILYVIYGSTGYVDASYQFRYEELSNTYHSSFNKEDTIDVGSYELNFNLIFYNGYQNSYYGKIYTKKIIVSGIAIEPPQTTLQKVSKAIPYIIAGGLIIYYFKHKKKKRGFY